MKSIKQATTSTILCSALLFSACTKQPQPAEPNSTNFPITQTTHEQSSTAEKVGGYVLGYVLGAIIAAALISN